MFVDQLMEFHKGFSMQSLQIASVYATRFPNHAANKASMEMLKNSRSVPKNDGSRLVRFQVLIWHFVVNGKRYRLKWSFSFNSRSRLSSTKAKSDISVFTTSLTRVPALTASYFFCRSFQITPLYLSRDTRVSSTITPPLNECAEPNTRNLLEFFTRSTISASAAG